MRERVQLTGFTACPRIGKRGITCSASRTPTSGLVRGVWQMRSSIPMRSTETSPRTATPFTPTSNARSQFSVLGFQFPSYYSRFSVSNLNSFLMDLHLNEWWVSVRGWLLVVREGGSEGLKI